MKAILYFCFSLFLFSNSLNAQEMFGIGNSNYSGIIGTFVNPAYVVGSPYYKEINIMSFDFSLHNNYIYIPKNEFYHFSNYKGPENEHGVMRDDYTTEPDKHAYGNVAIIGPSIMISGQKNGFAFHTAFRNNFSVRDLNYHLAKFIWDGFDYSPQHGIPYTTDPFKGMVVSYYELGATYGQTLIDNHNTYVTAGATFNLNLSGNGLFIKSEDMDYIVPDATLLTVTNLTAKYGHTMTAEEIKVSDILKPKGVGAGLNLGVNFVSNRNKGAYSLRNDRLKKYDFRVGASVLDFGMLQFSSDAVTFDFKNDSTNWPGINDVDFQSLYEADTAINNHFTGTPNGAYENSRFNIWLPSAFALQFDISIIPRLYGYANAIQRIAFFENQVKRGNQLVAGFRYERVNYEASIQYSLYEYNLNRIGVAFRYKSFFIGSSTAMAISSLFDMYGIDVYMGVKITNKKSRQRSGTVDDCFEY